MTCRRTAAVASSRRGWRPDRAPGGRATPRSPLLLRAPVYCLLALGFHAGHSEAADAAATGHLLSDPARDSTQTPGSDSSTTGSVSLAGGSSVAYTAVAGSLIVGASDAQDAKLGLDGAYRNGTEPDLRAGPEQQPPTARMSYTAYFARSAKPGTRPIVFIYDGGPGSSSRSLLMASFGPVQVVIPDLQHPVGGPYRVVNNPDCLLDAGDLVFIDAPGTGFGSIQGQDATKAFYGIDQDASAFARFIQRFLTKYQRWDSPKYLFGHSYGTVRNAALGWQLLQDDIDLNGIISVGQYLNFDDFLDGAKANPGVENAIFLALPSYAAIAWFHHTVPNRPAQLEPWLAEVERYALGDYASALLAGSGLSQAAEQAVAAKLESFTGIPAATWLKADLRLTGSEYEKMLLARSDLTIGRLDARYDGPAMDPMAAEAQYDPFANSTSSAIAAGVNSYARNTLHFGRDLTYQADADVPDLKWDIYHTNAGKPWLGFYNVLPDLAQTLERNPKMHLLVMGGYFDLSTTFFASMFEMKHLAMPRSLDGNIEYQFYPAGHEPYVNPGIRHAMHDRLVRFIGTSDQEPEAKP